MEGTNGIKAKGRKELRKYLAGSRLTQRQAILAKCYECSNGYADGKTDCGIKECPLYPSMPYRESVINDPVFASGT